MPENRSLSDADLREIHTYCRVLDLGVTGKVTNLLDMVMQRLKAKVVAVKDGNWKAAQHMKLLPPSRHLSVLSMGEEEFIRRVSAGEIRLSELLEKYQISGGARSGDGNRGGSGAQGPRR